MLYGCDAVWGRSFQRIFKTFETSQPLLKECYYSIQRPFVSHVQMLFWRQLSYFPFTIPTLISVASECLGSIDLFCITVTWGNLTACGEARLRTGESSYLDPSLHSTLRKIKYLYIYFSKCNTLCLCEFELLRHEDGRLECEGLFGWTDWGDAVLRLSSVTVWVYNSDP